MENDTHVEDGFSGIKKNENVKTLILVKQVRKRNKVQVKVN